MTVNPIPEGQEGFIPYLLVDGGPGAIAFYTQAFGATEAYRMEMPDGSVAHAEIRIDGHPIYLADAPDDMEMPGCGNPSKLGGTPVLLHHYVTDCDAAVDRAVAAGASVMRPPTDEFYGDRAATVVDPYGHVWSLHTHVRDVSPEEMAEAAAAMAADHG